MATDAQTAFFSYSRADSEFALRLAKDLKAAGANVWLDQLDIAPGQRWDRAIEDALDSCPRMLVVLSPASVVSENVRDEISSALDKQKPVIPVLHRDCKIPLRLRRVLYVDFRNDYDTGLKQLLKTLQQHSSPTLFSPEELSKTMSNPKYADDIRTLDAENSPDSVIRKHTIIIVVGTGVSSELLDRSVAELLRNQIDKEGGGYRYRRGIVLTDAEWYSEESFFGNRPVIAIGSPGVNKLSAKLHTSATPMLWSEGTLNSISEARKLTWLSRLNQEEKPQVALWGEHASRTREAVKNYINDSEGLPKFLKTCWSDGDSP